MLREAALKIHEAMEGSFLSAGAIVGPDPGVRFNYRIWRFLKGYTPWIGWQDGLYYLQCQGYWVMANWLLASVQNDRFANLAVAATSQIVARQRPDGGWDYPNPEWKGRSATVEGVFASLALIESYRRTGNEQYLQSALRWHAYFTSNIGFQSYRGLKAVNYFAGCTGNPVPNNSALALRYLASLADVSGDNRLLEACSSLVEFLKRVQRPTGEFPYAVDDRRMQHFQCFQYHAFIYLDIWNYYRITGDRSVLDVLHGILRFLKSGISAEGFGYYQCAQLYRTVHYHTAAIATALSSSHGVELSEEQGIEYRSTANRAFQYLCKQQLTDGSLPHSRGEYFVLCDHRKYPRYMAMILYHLLSVSDADGPTEKTARQ